MKQHPRISRRHIVVGGGIIGAVFAIGACLISFLPVAEVRWFLLSIPFGLCIAALLYVWHKRRPVEVTGADDATRLKLS